MARFEQVAWQWNEVQRYAEEFKRDFPDDTLTVQAEELFHSPAKAQEIFAFIGIAPQKESKIARLIKRPVNRQRTGSVEPYDEWPDEEKDKLRRAASLHVIYGYSL